ncbi:ester cyclase [Sodalis ligni]|uniref:ester cyclase n=1 Tax=Sodalis ligni TaxID=2697027 RepID=UPI00193FCC92|nr:ester cyclase [Sodalis ligni]QWA09157.1 ester cyclase [Sodalis ligni]
MTLHTFYHAYIDCLNKQDWGALSQYVAEDVHHNGRPLKLAGYRAMLVKDFQDIPDLHFVIDHLICEPPFIAARLAFNCSPKGDFLGLNIDGRRVSFAENVFYEVRSYRIVEVWSIIDKHAIELQIMT